MTHPTRVPRRPRPWPALALTVAATSVIAAQLLLGLAPAGSPVALLLATAAAVPVGVLLWVVHALRAYERAAAAHAADATRQEIEDLKRRLRALEIDHEETIESLVTKCYGYKLQAEAAAERAADPVLQRAVEAFAPEGVLQAVPSIRDIKGTVRCGQSTAQRVKAYLSEYAAA